MLFLLGLTMGLFVGCNLALLVLGLLLAARSNTEENDERRNRTVAVVAGDGGDADRVDPRDL